MSITAQSNEKGKRMIGVLDDLDKYFERNKTIRVRVDDTNIGAKYLKKDF